MPPGRTPETETRDAMETVLILVAIGGLLYFRFRKGLGG